MSIHDGCKIKGPLIIKTESGLGRLHSNVEHVASCQEMMEKGVNILLGLPNGTECTQEMDQGFVEFNSATAASTTLIAAMKIVKS